jgi:Zn-dependent metalloprotease
VSNFSEFQKITDDRGGVHLFSGIPNKAFYLVATAFEGNSWKKAGQIWWQAMNSGQIPPRCTFQQFADITVEAALESFDEDAAKVVRKAWEDVGVKRGI